MCYKHLTEILFLILFAAIISGPSYAQNEVERERSSLKGINDMGFTVNVEANISINERGELEVTSIRDQAINKLRESGLSIVPDKQIRSSADLPFLYMHINTMDAGRGLVPFSISLDFYQPVKLTLNRDTQTSASTWQTGVVGIVSYDRLNVIAESAVDLLQDFIDDYHQVNL